MTALQITLSAWALVAIAAILFIRGADTRRRPVQQFEREQA
jgi:hypothetical protein